MAKKIEIHTQDSSSRETVDFATLYDTVGGIQPTNFAGSEIAYVSLMQTADGKRYRVTFSCSKLEAQKAGNDTSNLDWDAAHVVRIENC